MTAEFYMGLMLGLSIGAIGIFFLCMWGVGKMTELQRMLRQMQQEMQQESIRSQKQPEE